MSKYQEEIQRFRPELVEELRSPQAAVRAAAIRQLDRTNLTQEEAALIFPPAAERFTHESAKVYRKLLASLCVRAAEAARDIPGLPECLALTLREAKTRNDKYQAFNTLQIASAKGWDITPAVPLLLDAVQTQWGNHTLRTLAQAARSGLDVLSFAMSDGFQAWELFRLTLELTRFYDTRRGILEVLTGLARQQASHLGMFLLLVEDAAADTRMSPDFLKVAAICLAAFREAGIKSE